MASDVKIGFFEGREYVLAASAPKGRETLDHRCLGGWYYARPIVTDDKDPGSTDKEVST